MHHEHLTLVVRGPFPVKLYCNNAFMTLMFCQVVLGLRNPSEVPVLSMYARSITAWSTKCDPTGRSWTTGIPNDDKWSAGPTPESIKIFILLIGRERCVTPCISPYLGRVNGTSAILHFSTRTTEERGSLTTRRPPSKPSRQT